MNCIIKDNQKYSSVTENVIEDVDKLASEKVSELEVNRLVKSMGYSSVSNRNFAKRLAANDVLTVLNKLREKNKKVVGSKKAFFKKEVKVELSKRIANRIADKNKVQKVDSNGKATKGYKEIYRKVKNDIQYVVSQLENVSPVDNDYIAWYREAFNEDEATSNNFFNEVFADGRLSKIRFSSDDEFGEYSLNDAVDAQEDNSENSTEEDGTNPENMDDDDLYNAVAAFEHSGTFSTFMKHVDDDVKVYLSTLPKLISSKKVAIDKDSNDDSPKEEKFTLDKNNPFESKDFIDAQEAIIMLYRQGDFTNADAMVKSIEMMAERYKGFESFAKFAEDLKKNADFKYLVYCNFGKLVMTKQEVIVDDNNGTSRQSNRRSNPEAALTFEFLNSIKTTSISVDHNSIMTQATALLNSITTAKSIIKKDYNSSGVRQLIEDLVKLLNIYYPTIDKYSVSSYIYNNADINGNVDPYSNITTIHGLLKSTIEKSKDSLVKYNDIQLAISNLRYKANMETRMNAEAGVPKKITYAKELQELYNEEYISQGNNNVATELAQKLAPYSLVKIELNSRNVHGNQSSDVLNNNMLTNLMNTLQSTLNRKVQVKENGITKEVWVSDCPLQHYKEFKFQSKQYNFSNILLEKRDDKNNVINYGLFRRLPTGEVVPTEYAKELIQVSLFSGATSFDNSKNTLYSEMSSSDYITTAFIGFFNSTAKVKGVTMGNYFMRIPSDAPKNYVISAPRYSIAGLNQGGKINHNHPIFRQFRAAFEQELLDMAVAINTMFETTDDGVVVRENGQLKFKEGFGNTAEGLFNLYKEYHYIGKSATRVVDGKEVLTGNAFKSNKFIVFDEETGQAHNFGQDIIDTLFMLYAGQAQRVTAQHIAFKKDSEGKVEDLTRTAEGYLFSEEFDNLVNSKIDDFIKAYSKEAIKRLSKNKDIITAANKNLVKDDATFNSLASEFVLNHHLMYINFDDLFEGSTKFYRGAQDFLKRAKEVQGSGTPYGLVNYNAQFNPLDKKVVEDSALNTLYKDLGISQYDAFSAVTIKNTIRTSEEASPNGLLAKKLAEIFVKNGMSETAAMEKANNMMAGYQGTKVNDAQSYITFEEWVRRIAARGQLGKYAPLIRRIQEANANPNITLNTSDIEEFVQVQKNFYYDHHYDPTTGIIAPRQIKNAEFVLVPCFIRGTQLYGVYNMMVNNNIDQLNTEETSKAGKRAVLTLFDDNGKITAKNISDFNAKAGQAIEYYSYNNLYTQQETPQHVNAENKAGIQVMKKILDNIQPGSTLWNNKQTFINMYGEKVFRSFNKLMDDCGVQRDENNNIIVDSDGKISGLDYDKFYERFREEAERLGIDSNMNDYLTLEDVAIDGVKISKMPNLFNGTANKIESIAQSIFNSAITRQKLHGFHAAQVTNVGMTSLRTVLANNQSGTPQVTYSKELHYHSDENGKYQPYIEVKLPKSAFNLPKNEDGTYILTDEEALRRLQAKGLDLIIGYRIPTEGKQSIAVMKVVGFTDDAQGSTIIVPDDWVSQTGSDFDIDSIYAIQKINYVDKKGNLVVPEYTEDKDYLYRRYVFDNISDEERNQLYEDSKLNQATIDELKANNDNKEVVRELIAQYKSESFNANLEDLAEEKGLLSKDEYFEKNTPLSLNSDAAIDNNLVTQMLTILQNDESLEENLSRSNFDDITDARDRLLSAKAAAKRENRDSYNILDNADMQDDVMSGAKLKGFSVTRDNLCSVCNTVRPHLATEAYTIIYPAEKLNFAELKERFGENNVEWGDDDYKTIKVTHRMFGHSNDDKNVVGKILTAYSSQTTAHILDAVKEGNIPNVNDLTFAVYKSFVDVGSDYNTAVGFMMQPAIGRIVDAYNANKSIYISGNKNPIQQALRSLAEEVGIKTKDKKKNISIGNIVTKFAENEELASAFKNLFGVDLKIEGIIGNNITFDDFALPSHKLEDRLKEQGEFSTTSPVGKMNQAAFDLGIILKYSQYAMFSQRIGDIARVSNPDKFGAKQSIYATAKVFEDIETLINANDIPLFVDTARGEVSFLESIYPGITHEDGEDIVEHFVKAKDNHDSLYYPLYAFLKYSTAPSVVVNRQLFETQQKDFREVVNQLTSVFKRGQFMTEKEYKGYEKYVLGYIYNQVPFISCAINLNDAGNFVPNFGSNQFDERQRVYGFGYSTQSTFEVKDINNPTTEELNEWKKLSPAQKVLWIQQHSLYGGVFATLRVDLRNNNRTRKGAQTIEFVENNQDIEIVYQQFANAYYSTNPLIRYAAADLIKYGFLVEGFNFKRNAVNKIIQNAPLMESTETGGTGIVQSVRSLMKQAETGSYKELPIMYARGHNMRQIAAINLKDLASKRMQDSAGVETEVRVINLNTETGDATARESGLFYIDENGYDAVLPVFRTNGKNPTTYRTRLDGGYIYFYPINNLEANEYGDWSVNPKNNKFKHPAYYEGIINGTVLATEGVAYSAPNLVTDKTAGNFDINSPKNETERADFNRVKNEVIAHEHEIAYSKPLYIWSPSLGNYIKNAYHAGSSIQTINGREYRISKWPVNRVIKKYLTPENYNREVTERDSNYKDVVDQLRAMNFKNGSNDIYRIEPYVKEEYTEVDVHEMQSSVTEKAGETAFNNIEINAKGGDRLSKALLNDAARRGIIADASAIGRNLEDSYSTLAEYVSKKSDKIFHDLNNFIQDEEGNYHNVLSDYTVKVLLNNPAERRRYLKLLLDAKKIARQFGMYSGMNITSDDETIRKAVEIIKNKVAQLNDAIVDSGIELYAEQYLSKISDNPLVQSRVIDLLNGYYGSGIIETMIGDTQEMPNPLIQIITKDCMADIRAKEMQTREAVKAFHDKLANIREKAAAEGLTVNWDNIVDEDGKFIQPYTQEFKQKYATLVKNIETLEGTTDWESNDMLLNAASGLNILKAKLELKKFLRDNTEQELIGTYRDDLGIEVKSFYDQEIELMEKMINDYGDIYGAYHWLTTRIAQCNSHITGGDVDKHWEDEVERLTNERKAIESLYLYDAASGAFVEKPSKSSPMTVGGHPNLIDTKEAVTALNNFKRKRADLFAKFYGSEEMEGFREQLNDYLRDIEEAEERDSLGRPTKSITQLQANSRWRTAKEWIRRNARFVPDPAVADEINKAFKLLGSGKGSATSKLLKTIAKAADAYDAKGVIDGTKLSIEQQRNLKKKQETEYAERAGVAFNASTIINSAGETDEVYTPLFYRKATGATNENVNAKNQAFKDIVEKINEILAPAYTKASKTIDWTKITPDQYRELISYYEQLDDIRDLNTSKDAREFVRDYVEYEENTAAFENARDFAAMSGVDMNLWNAVNTEVARDDAGNIIRNADGTIKHIPRRYIYCTAKPNAAARTLKNKKGKSLYINEEKTDALKTIKGFCITTQTEYYTQELEKRRAEADRGEVNADGRTYQEWYEDNHVYDPITHNKVPIRCWMESRINDAGNGTWEAGFNQSHRVALDEFANPNYSETKDIGVNYKPGNYDNTGIAQNKYEKEASDYLKSLLKTLGKVHSAEQFFKSGNLPIRSLPEQHDAKWAASQALKTAGITETHSGRENFDPEITYDVDTEPDMPMTHMLRDPNVTKQRRKLHRPERDHYLSDDDYNRALENYKNKVEALDKADEEYHKKMLDRNWESVIEDFILKAAHYNAVQDNKAQLYYGQEVLKNQLQLDTNLGRHNLNKDKRRSNDARTKYVTRQAAREYEQYTNWMRRLIFNQFKEQNNNWTKVAGVLQSVASANYMMMNIRGGIANVTLGETNILAEAWAKEYFDAKDYLKGKQIWTQGIVSYFTHMYKETSGSVADALIKFMNVVDFDEINGVVTVAGMDKYLERMRNFMFSPQTMGEHFMQNGALFSIMVGSRLYKNDNPEENGKTEYVVKHRAEAIRDAHEKALQELLTDEEKLDFKAFVKKTMGDENTGKEVAWFRQDLTSEYVFRHFDHTRQAEFNKRKAELEKQAMDEFDSLPDMMSQFVLGSDGKLAFAPGSIMEQLNEPKLDADGNPTGEPSDAYRIMGALKGRVISVNKKIHGVYDKLGAAQLEKHWYGSLVMQYHKHIYPGIMKRFRIHGYFNEERGTVEKGSRIALFDFLSIPIRKYKYEMQLKENEVEGLEGIQNCLQHIADFCMHIQLNWNTLPDYERANIKRNLGDIAGVMSALCFAIAIRAIGDDDEDGFFYNLALYEADRLASESAMFSVWGGISEAKKLWSSPVAVQSIINDVLSSANELSQMILEGEDYDPYYHSGKYAGKRKLEVYVKRRIPIYRGFYALAHVADDNSYYKLADNMLSVIPVKDIANWIKGK